MNIWKNYYSIQGVLWYKGQIILNNLSRLYMIRHIQPFLPYLAQAQDEFCLNICPKILI